MKKIFIILLCYPLIGLSQVNYTITVNTNDAWDGNLFFQRGGPPQKPVKIVDPSGTEIFSENWGMKGWDFKVNYNNKLSYFDRSSKGWFIMDSLQNEIDSIYAQNGYIADNHDFLALPNGNYVIGNCHAGPGQPLLVELNPKNKKVVWTFDRFEDFGNNVSNSLILDAAGKSLR